MRIVLGGCRTPEWLVSTTRKRRNEAERRYRVFLNRLRRFTVLDPVCGDSWWGYRRSFQ